MIDQLDDAMQLPADAAGAGRFIAAAHRFWILAHVVAGRLDTAGGYDMDGHVALAPWLLDIVRLDPRTAKRLASTARKLADLPALEAAAVAGSVTPAQVEVVLEGIGRHRVAFAATGAPVVESLTGLTLAETVAVMSEWRERMDNERPTPPDDKDGATLSFARHFENRLAGRFDLPADDGHELVAALELADCRDENLSVAERRGDALMTLARFFVGHQGCAKPGRSGTHVHVVVLPEELAAGTGGRHADGTPVDDLGVLACDAVLHRLVVLEDGTILSHGRSERLFTDAQRRVLAVRDGGCRFPGCDRPASWADAHHIHHWETGGPTDIDNGVLLCRRHHRLVHRQSFELKLLPDATLHVTFPDGRERTTTPALRRPRPPDRDVGRPAA